MFVLDSNLQDVSLGDGICGNFDGMWHPCLLRLFASRFSVIT